MSNERLFSVYRREDGPGKRPMEWAAREDGDKIEVWAGVSGDTVQRVHGSASVWGSFDEISGRKVREGYVLVGYGDYPDGRLRLLYAWDPEAERKVPAGTLHWVSCKAVERSAFEALTERMAEGLTRVGVSAHAPNARGGGRPGLAVETLEGEWAIRLQPDGALTERGRTGPGRVTPAQGTLPTVAMLRIERAFPGSIAFVWTSGHTTSRRTALRMHPEVVPHDTWLGTAAGRFEDTERAAKAVGLFPGLLPVEERGGPKPIWF